MKALLVAIGCLLVGLVVVGGVMLGAGHSYVQRHETEVPDAQLDDRQHDGRSERVTTRL